MVGLSVVAVVMTLGVIILVGILIVVTRATQQTDTTIADSNHILASAQIKEEEKQTRTRPPGDTPTDRNAKAANALPEPRREDDVPHGQGGNGDKNSPDPSKSRQNSTAAEQQRMGPRGHNPSSGLQKPKSDEAVPKQRRERNDLNEQGTQRNKGKPDDPVNEQSGEQSRLTRSRKDEGASSAPAKKDPRDAEVVARLSARVEFPGFDNPNLTLSGALAALEKRYKLSFDINGPAFGFEEVSNVGSTRIFQESLMPPMNEELGKVLQAILERVPVLSGARYQVRRGRIEVTTGAGGAALKEQAFLLLLLDDMYWKVLPKYSWTSDILFHPPTDDLLYFLAERQRIFDHLRLYLQKRRGIDPEIVQMHRDYEGELDLWKPSEQKCRIARDKYFRALAFKDAVIVERTADSALETTIRSYSYGIPLEEALRVGLIKGYETALRTRNDLEPFQLHAAVTLINEMNQAFESDLKSVVARRRTDMEKYLTKTVDLRKKHRLEYMQFAFEGTVSSRSGAMRSHNPFLIVEEADLLIPKQGTATLEEMLSRARICRVAARLVPDLPVYDYYRAKFLSVGGMLANCAAAKHFRRTGFGTSAQRRPEAGILAFDLWNKYLAYEPIDTKLTDQVLHQYILACGHAGQPHRAYSAILTHCMERITERVQIKDKVQLKDKVQPRFSISRSVTFWYDCARICSLLKDVELAAQFLEHAVKLGFSEKEAAFVNPDFKNLLQNPRTADLFARLFNSSGPANPQIQKLTALFNGRDLIGWKQNPSPSNFSQWIVQNGAIISNSKGRLYTSRNDYQDFYLKTEVSLEAGSIGSLQFRTEMMPEGADKTYNISLHANANEKTSPGSITACSGGLKPSLRTLASSKCSTLQPERWYVLELLVSGWTFQVKIDGQVVAEATDDHHEYVKGSIALQRRRLVERRIRFRKIEIRELAHGSSPEG